MTINSASRRTLFAISLTAAAVICTPPFAGALRDTLPASAPATAAGLARRALDTLAPNLAEAKQPRGEGRAEIRGEGRAEIRGEGRAEIRGEGRAEPRGEGRAETRGDSRAEGRAESWADIAERVTAGVVNVSTTRTERRGDGDSQGAPHPFHDDPFFRRFFGPDFGHPRGNPHQRRQISGMGSGVIIDASGIILTNNHVVENADQILIKLSDGRELEASIVGTDPQSDLAVLKLKEKAKKLTALEFGDSSKLRLAEEVLAIGNPFGVGQTVTKGIVSATGRANVGIAAYEDFIQTDAAINPGNSGGALLNDRGELIGINTAIVSRSGGFAGIGFAIPANMAKQIKESLIEHGKVIRGWLGVVIQNVDKDLSEALGLADNNGVLIADVQADSPAEKGGVEVGDVVVALNGEPVESTGELRNLVAGAGAGTKVRLDVIRDGSKETLKIVLGELPPELAGPAGVGGQTPEIEVAALNDTLRKKYAVPDTVTGGVVVTGLSEDSEAAAKGLRPGDVILKVNKEPSDTAKEFRRLYDADENRALLFVWRDGGTRFMVIQKNSPDAE